MEEDLAECFPLMYDYRCYGVVWCWIGIGLVGWLAGVVVVGRYGDSAVWVWDGTV